MKRFTGVNELDLINCIYAIRYSIEKLNIDNYKDYKNILVGIAEKIEASLLKDNSFKITNKEEVYLYISLYFFKDELELKGEDIGANSVNETLWNIFGDIMGDISAENIRRDL